MSEINAAVKIEEISPVKKKLVFDIPWVDVKNELDAVYRKVGRTARVKGFRPGKIPRAILERHYREQAEDEAVTGLVNRVYWKTLQEKEIPAVTRPQIEQAGIEQDKDFSFSAIIEVEPVVEPKDYIGLEIVREDPAVTEADLEQRLQEIRQMFSTMEDVTEDRGVVAGDFVTLDFTGRMDGERLKELSAENQLLEIGSGNFVPGFEDRLIGMRKEETRSFTLRLPEKDVPAHLADKEAEFEVTVRALRVKRAPEIDDQFIKNFERYDSLEALKSDVRKNLEEEKKQKSDAALEKSVSDGLLAVNDFEVPDAFVDRQILHMMSDMQRRMTAGGMDKKKATELALRFRDQFRDEAVKIVKTVFLIKAIAAKEGLTVDDREVQERIAEIATQRAQDYDTLKKSLEDEDLIEGIQSDILSRKTYEYLIGKARITTVGGDKTQSPEDKA